MRALKAIIALLFVLAGIIIGALNQQSVDIDLLFFHYQAHIGLALILSLLAGVVIGGSVTCGDGATAEHFRMGESFVLPHALLPREVHLDAAEVIVSAAV